jgi:predicted Zn-ribbon and HTH transcriptional regulator
MRDKNHYLKLLARKSEAGVGLLLAARAVYAARYGDADEAIINDNYEEFSGIARDLKLRYGENLTTDEVRAEMLGRYPHDCRECGWQWVSIKEHPKTCPNPVCRSPFWDGKPKQKRGRKKKPAV